MAGIEWCRIYNTGHCKVPERLMVSSGTWRTILCPALTVALRHSTYGIILFDTGVAPRINEMTEYFPNRLYRSVVKFDCRPEASLVSQLASHGIAAADVRIVVLSHVHADHLGGLLDFPTAEIVVSAKALEFFRKMHGLRAVAHAVLPDLMPGNLKQRSRIICCSGSAISGFQTVDLFGDTSIRLVDLPGHSPGHLGMVVEVSDQQLFFVADACWHSRVITHAEPPCFPMRLIAHDWASTQLSIERIRQFSANNPECRIIPSHCPIAAGKFTVRGSGYGE